MSLFSNYHRQTRYLLSVFGWFLLALATCELLLRMTVRNPVVFIYDPVWGRRPAANSTMVFGTEGYGITHYSADGEIATPYHGGANIVVLGDSNTEAYQVNDSEKYVSLAEQQVRREGLQIDLRNLGISGASLADYAYLAPYIKEKYQPVAVVIQISPEDFWGDEGFSQTRSNYFTVNNDGSLQLIHQPPNSADASINQLKHLLAIFDYGYDRLKNIQANIKPIGATKNTPKNPLPVLSDPITTVATQDQAQQMINALNTAYQNVKVIIVLLPYTPKIKKGTIIISDPEYSSLLSKLEAISGWQIVNPEPQFTVLAEHGQLPRGFGNTLPGEGHMNIFGHSVVAELLAQKIVTILK